MWRWLLGKWTRVSHSDLDNVILQAQEELNKTSSAKFFPPDNQEVIARLEEVSQEIIKKREMMSQFGLILLYFSKDVKNW